MAASRHDDNDGSDIFWPGYVDATTNLILNLLFLLTILIVAVFMFALELGRSSKVVAEKPQEVVEQAVPAVAQPTPAMVQENLELKREIERLNKVLATAKPQVETAGTPVKTVKATAVMPKPKAGLDKTASSDLEIVVRFADDAVALTQVEHDQLLETLQPVVAGGKAKVVVEVPAGFSEAKRMGFYRAMAVRNILLEMKVEREDINVSVVEGKQDANASLVRVRPR